MGHRDVDSLGIIQALSGLPYFLHLFWFVCSCGTHSQVTASRHWFVCWTQFCAVALHRNTGHCHCLQRRGSRLPTHSSISPGLTLSYFLRSACWNVHLEDTHYTLFFTPCTPHPAWNLPPLPCCRQGTHILSDMLPILWYPLTATPMATPGHWGLLTCLKKPACNQKKKKKKKQHFHHWHFQAKRQRHTTPNLPRRVSSAFLGQHKHLHLHTCIPVVCTP